MFVYKKDIQKALKENGWNTYRIRKEKVFSQTTMQLLREKKMVGITVLDKICTLLNCRIEDIIEHVNESEDLEKTEKEG